MSVASLFVATLLAAPGIVPVQGYLTDTSGTPVDGEVQMTFRLYADATATLPFYSDTLTLDVVEGRFSTNLGGGAQTLDLTRFAMHPEVHLAFQLASDDESPRVRLGAVPYAAYAHAAMTLGGETLEDVLAQIPESADIQGDALAVCKPASYVPAWSELMGIPSDLADGDATLTQAEVEGYARGVCVDSESELTALLNDDYTYAAGNGLTLASNTFAMSEFAGGPLIPNARFESGNLTGWTIGAGAGTVVADALTPSAGGGFAFRNNALSVAWISNSARVPVRAATTYRVSGKFRRVDTNAANLNGTIYLAVRLFDVNGNNIGGDGTWWFYAVNALELASTDNVWHVYGSDFGEPARPIPAAARTMTVGAILNFNGGNRTYEVTDLQIRAVTYGETRGAWLGGAMQNGWVNYDAIYSPFGYLKDASGFVHLRGLIKNGTAPTAFTLPPRFRPAYRTLLSTQSNNGGCRVDVLTSGEIQLLTNCSNSWTSLEGLTFAAEL